MAKEAKTKKSFMDITLNKKKVAAIEWEQLELIARYYEFPTMIFLLSSDEMKKQFVGTRNDEVKNRIKQAANKLIKTLEENTQEVERAGF